MPPRPRTGLTPERKVKLVAELQVFQAAIRRAEEDLKVHVAMANAAGMSLREIADVLEVKSPNTISLWKAEGEQARERRRGGDPGGSGEHPILS